MRATSSRSQSRTGAGCARTCPHARDVAIEACVFCACQGRWCGLGDDDLEDPVIGLTQWVALASYYGAYRTDIFHDVFGHVPLLANPVYADFMQAYGEGGHRALSRGRLANLARLYWYTIEFGLMRTPNGLRIFGAGIMSSVAESIFALETDSPYLL